MTRRLLPKSLRRLRERAMSAMARPWGRRASPDRHVSRLHDALEIASRIGFGANGFVYVSVGVIAVAAAVGLRHRAIDQRSLVYVLAQQPLGRVWLVMLGAGLCAFVLWRVLQSVFDADRQGTSLRGWAVRVTYLFAAAFYAALAWGVFEYLEDVGPSMPAEQVSENQATAAMVLALPFGGALLMLVGLIIAGVGVGNIVMGVVNDFARTLSCSKAVCRWVLPLARVGYVGLGLTYLPLAVLVVTAGWTARSSGVGSLGSALDALQRQPAGPFFLGLAGVGLIAFGAYAFVEARFRRIRRLDDLQPL